MFLYSEGFIVFRYFLISPARCLGDLKVHPSEVVITKRQKSCKYSHAGNIKAKEAVYLVEFHQKASNTAASGPCHISLVVGDTLALCDPGSIPVGKAHVIRATIKMGLDKVIERGSRFCNVQD